MYMTVFQKRMKSVSLDLKKILTITSPINVNNTIPEILIGVFRTRLATNKQRHLSLHMNYVEQKETRVSKRACLW